MAGSRRIWCAATLAVALRPVEQFTPSPTRVVSPRHHVHPTRTLDRRRGGFFFFSSPKGVVLRAGLVPGFGGPPGPPPGGSNSNNNNDNADEDDLDAAEEAARKAFWKPYLTNEIDERSAELDVGGDNRVAAQYVLLLTKKHPNDLVREFYSSASVEAQVAVRDAIQAVLGALDVEWTTTGKRVAELCFRLQMTGYMLRNAEYVEALKKILDVSFDTAGPAARKLRKAFDDIDKDRDGVLSLAEVEALFNKIYYDGDARAMKRADPETEGKKRKEIESFVQYFDANGDGYVSFDEFRDGLGVSDRGKPLFGDAPPPADPADDDPAPTLLPAEVGGTVELVFPSGATKKVDAGAYVRDLRARADQLREALDQARAEADRVKGTSASSPKDSTATAMIQLVEQAGQDAQALSRYVQNANDARALTATITPDAREAMDQLVAFVLGGAGDPARGKIPPDARLKLQNRVLQQLCQWQIVVGYRIRELEALGVARDRAGK